ncbi:MAG: rhodanese-like domain-containing protein [Trueperaceae bacterium]
MLFQHIYDEDLAQASYLIGCQATGEAIVVDPRRDVERFVALAERHGLRIAHVTETHVHADFQSGSRELAARTGARLHLSAEGGPDWSYAFEGEPLRHGDVLKVGNLRVEAVHTPGHTPEHLSFLVTDGATTEQPGFLLTGDFVFVGDVGRPDLLDEAAGGVDTRFEGAKQLFASLRDHFLTLPDFVQVWPGHGAGSACGKALGAVASTTVGYERLVAWWVPYVQDNDEQGFVDVLLDGQPDAPLYFGRMKVTNKAGPALLGERPPVPELALDDVRERLGATGDLVLVDTRVVEEGALDLVPGAYVVPEGKKFATYASYAIDPASERRGLVLLAGDAAQAAWMRDRLGWTGIDQIAGFVTSLAGLTAGPAPTVAPAELEHVKGAFLLDVRTASEHAAGAIPGALQRHVGRVAFRNDDLPTDRPIVVYCQTGARASVAAGALRALGFDDVRELEGSYDGYVKAARSKDAPVTA